MPQEKPDEDDYLQLMRYLQELETIEQPGVGGDQPEEGSCYLETEPVDYSIPEKGEKKKKKDFKCHSNTFM